MSKKLFDDEIERWVMSFIAKEKDISFSTFHKKVNISKLNEEESLGVRSIEYCDFTCEFAFIVETKIGSKELILINRRYDKSIGLVDIGEMSTYCKIANPLYSFLISNKGYSKEIANNLVDYKISKRLFTYSDERSVILFTLESDKIVPESVLPLWKRDFINE